MNHEINYDLYLKRIGITTKLKPGLETLVQLQKQHMLHVPFENIDIYHGVPVTLDPVAIYDKIVLRNRGGYCYECNGLFHLLLQWIGFDSRMISCRVVTGKKVGEAFDHMALIIVIEGQEWLVDVGFGHFSAVPLLLENDLVQFDAYADYCIRPYGMPGDKDCLGAGRFKSSRNEWTTVYVFTREGYPLEAFQEMNIYQQTSPDSHFTKNLICSQLTETGRLSLVNNRLITTKGTEKEDRLVYGPTALNEVLNDSFNIFNAVPQQKEIQE